MDPVVTGRPADTAAPDVSAKAPAQRRRVLAGMGANAAARLVVLPVSALLGLVVTRLVIGRFGEADYAQYMLLVGLGALIPFADLGISAAVMNAVSESPDPRNDAHLRRVLVTTLRVLTGSAAVISLLALVVTLTGSWHALLGDGLRADTGSGAAALSVVVIGVTLIVSFGQRILVGLNRYFVVILVQGLQTPVVLVVLLLMIAGGATSAAFLPVVAYAATFVLTIVVALLANRAIRPTLGLAVRDAFRLRSVRGARVMDTALPMLVQMIALPLSMQSDRLVLSHVAGIGSLAEYSLAAQMYNPFVGVIAVAGMSLWPVFARARATGARSEVSPTGMAVMFGGVGLLVALVVTAASGFLARLASGGRIDLSVPLLVAFSCLLVMQAVKYPLGMYMTTPRGLRFQALMVVLMLPVNLGLSVVLAQRMGAAGPVIGSAIGVAIFQVAANWRYVKTDLRRTAQSGAAE